MEISLNCLRYLNSSQCSYFSGGVMCACLYVRVTARVSAFSICCRRLVLVTGSN